MAPRLPQLTTYVLPASASPLALVIRRGPSKWWHFLLWDRDSGVVTPGSWFHGLIYPWCCDLSPKGDWMLILAYRATNTPPAWTALCTPPSVSAQVFWPLEHPKVGGGFFDDRLQVAWLNLAMSDSEGEVRGRHPWEFGFQESDETTFYGGADERMNRDGWKSIKPTPGESGVRWRKASPKRNGELIASFAGSAADLQSRPERFFEPGALRYSYVPAGPENVPAPLEGVTWAGFNSRGDVCVVRGTHLVLLKPGEAGFAEIPVMDLSGLTPRISPSQTPPIPVFPKEP